MPGWAQPIILSLDLSDLIVPENFSAFRIAGIRIRDKKTIEKVLILAPIRNKTLLQELPDHSGVQETRQNFSKRCYPIIDFKKFIEIND